MSQEPVSQLDLNPFADPNVPTLTRLLVLIEKDPTLTSAQKTAQSSAIRTVGRAIGLPLSAIPAHPKFLQKKLAKVSPARIGISVASWRNAKSLFGNALRGQGLSVMPGRYLAPISLYWKPLWDALPERPHKISLSRFIRFCSTSGLKPEDVSKTVFERFDTALRDESMVGKPEVVSRDTRRFWNDAGDLVTAWPKLRISVPDRRNHYTVPLGDFPASLANELETYRIALCGDVLDIDSVLKPIRPTSADHKVTALHRVASAAVANGMSPDSFPDIQAIVRPDTVRTAFRFIRERNGKDKLKSFDTLLAHVLSTARHWVEAPDTDIAALNKIKRALNINTYVMSDATSAVLRDLDDPKLLRTLIQLPQTVFDEVERKKDISRTDLIKVQVALAIAILICAPIRPQNLASLHLERHLIKIGAGRQRRRHIRIPGAEVKNGEDLEYPLPDRVERLLVVYLDKFRPKIVRYSNLFLFPGESTGHKKAGLLSNQIASLIETRLGVRITAHKFRAIAGKIILDQNPAGQEIARQVLGHRDINTTTTYYAPLQRDRAIQIYDKVLSSVGKSEVNQ